jgi:hypothetical protein
MGNGSGVFHGDRNRNARLERAEALPADRFTSQDCTHGSLAR